MSRIHPECPDSDPSDRSAAADVLLREEPDEEEDEEEDEGDGKEDDDDDDNDDITNCCGGIVLAEGHFWRRSLGHMQETRTLHGCRLASRSERAGGETD